MRHGVNDSFSEGDSGLGWGVLHNEQQGSCGFKECGTAVGAVVLSHMLPPFLTPVT